MMKLKQFEEKLMKCYQMIEQQILMLQNVTNNINDVSLKIQHAISLLQNKADNSALVEAKRQLDETTAEQDPTPGMTQVTSDNYRAKKQKQSELVQKQGVINNGDATAEEIRNEKAKVEEALTQLTEAKMH